MSTSRYKICFFNSCKVWGGGEKWHFDVAKGLSPEKFEVVLISNPESELIKKAQQENIKTIPVKITNLSFLNPFKVNRLSRLFKEENVSCIILNLPSDLKVAGIAAKRAGIYRIIYRRGSAIPIKNSLLNRYLFRHIVTGIIANSEETKRTILQQNPQLLAEEKIKVVYNGIEMDNFKEMDTVQAPEFYTRPVIIGNIGRLDYQKGQEYFIDLSRHLTTSDIRHRIVIAGEGPLQGELQAKINREKLSEVIELKGFVDDIPGFLKNIDIFVLTSRWEGFGYVLAEAMASYKPCIAFRVSSNPELIRDSYNGFLAEPFKTDQLAKAVAYLVNHPEKYAAFAQNGRRLFEEKFTLANMIRQVESYFLTVT